MGFEIEGALVGESADVEAASGFEVFADFILAFGLESAEFGHFLFAAAGEPGFLELEVAEVLTVGAADFHFENGSEAGAVEFFVGGGEFFLADGEEGVFEGWNSVETPAEVGDGLYEGGFFGADGFQQFFVREDVGLIGDGVVGREEDGDAGEAGFEGVERADCPTSGSFWAGGMLGVGAVSGNARGGWFGLRGGRGGRWIWRLRGFKNSGFTGGFKGLALGGATNGAS